MPRFIQTNWEKLQRVMSELSDDGLTTVICDGEVLLLRRIDISLTAGNMARLRRLSDRRKADQARSDLNHRVK